MTGGYVFAGYGITVGSLGLYAVRVLRRGRVLSRSLAGDAPLAAPDSRVPGPPSAEPAPTPTPASSGDQ